LSAILRDPTPRLSGVEHGEELQHVVNRCLAKDPGERYQTTKDLLADVRRIKRDTESGVRTVATTPSRKRVGRILVAAGVAVAGLVVFFWPRVPERFVPRVGRTIQVTRDPGLEIDPAISPDGKLVAYAAGPLGATRIYVKQVAGGRAVPLTEGLEEGDQRLPRWSPDGTTISFQSERTDGFETYIVPALGGAPRRFPTPPLASEVVWSPDGERIAYQLDDRAIFVGPADGNTSTRLCDVSEPSTLSWSPDGTRIAFSSGNSGYLYILLNAGPSSVWTVDLAGGEPLRVTEDANLDISPVWAPDGKSLLFVSDRGGGRDIYRISIGAEGDPLSDPERLTTGLDVLTIASSKDGRSLAYSVATSRQNIWSLPVPSEGPVSVREARPVTTGNQYIEGVDVSADGKWLVFDSNRSGNQDLFKMPVSGGEPVQLTTDPSMDCCPSWSPDGKEIAFHTTRTGNRDLFLVSSDGGTARQLTHDPAQERYPRWSPDGTRVAFQRTVTGSPQVFVISLPREELSEETAVQLTFDQAQYARWSPDGHFIAYERSAGVSVVASNGGEARPLTDFGTFPIWSKDGRTIFFKVSSPDDRAGIWAVSSSGGEPERLVRFDDPTRAMDRPEWSTDGETFYFTMTEYEADVWVMELEDSTI
jgi:Tol biopolymer transport system component